MGKHKILICDDEQEIIDILSLYFDKDLYEIFQANNGKEAYEILRREAIDLALIDIMMQESTGLELIEKVRNELNIPLIIISALDSLLDKLKGYEIGADDYITKPFEPMEVVAKVRARLKNIDQEATIIKDNSIELDLKLCQVGVGGRVNELTKVEMQVLRLLMSEPNRVFTKEQIYRAGWDEEYLYNDNSIRVIINRLRNIVGEEKIETVRGLGYRWRR